VAHLVETKTTALVCDHLAVFREGVKSVLERMPRAPVVRAAGRGEEAVALARQLQPDLAIVAIGLPDMSGFETVRAIRQESLASHILVIAEHASPNLAAEMMAAGACGFLLRNCSVSELLEAVKSVSAGRPYLPGNVFQRNGESSTPSDPFATLSDREIGVLRLLAEGHSVKEVASGLHLSVKTVDSHKYNIMRKLRIHNRAGLIRYAIRAGLIEP
jgi:two-component system response regulator NreC